MARIFDCFPFHNELDILQCRLEELSDVVDRFVVVECAETHLGASKESYYLGARERFRPWAHKIEYVWVPRLMNADPKEREHEHRERLHDGLRACGARPEDIVIQSDVDEIPTAASVRDLEGTLDRTPGEIVAFDQSPRYFAVDWKHPMRCPLAPAASRLAHITSFWAMRKASVGAPCIPNAGWHFSWLGGVRSHLTKINSIYEGPEISAAVLPLLVTGRNWREGIHVDGVQMEPAEVDDSFPRFIRERRCPATWFRPRGENL